jgi:hypothetical protein
MKFGIQATITKKQDNGYSTTKQIPFFYLYGNIQGIVSEEHAKKIAESILNPFEDENLVVSVFANKVED